MTPPVGLRLGNWLYLWLRAHEESSRGRPTVVLSAPDMSPWLDAFPHLRSLTIEHRDLRFHDRRVWDHEYRYQRYGVDFTRTGLEAFVKDAIAPQLLSTGSSDLVVNVRRGDYFTDAAAQAKFGFDQVGYLREALRLAGSADRIFVVSDDPGWCRRNLDDVLRMFAREVEFAPRDPLGNFRQIAGARRLIGMNSTFSYWGAYVAGTLDEAAVIVMPRFHARMDGVSDAYQLDPRWIAIEGFD